MGWYEFDETKVVECLCGWSGTAVSGSIEFFDECFAYECPQCGRTLAVFPHLSIEETKRRAAEGNEKAKLELPGALRREAFLKRAAASELRTPEQLPDLDGDELIIEWDFDDGKPGDHESWTVLRHEGQEIWREVAYFEGLDRYREVASILIEKYGNRLVGFPSTKASAYYLHGDEIYDNPVKSINERLAKNRRL